MSTPVYGRGIKDGRGYGPYGTGYYNNNSVDMPYGPRGERLSAEYDFQRGPNGNYLPPAPPQRTVLGAAPTMPANMSVGFDSIGAWCKAMGRGGGSPQCAAIRPPDLAPGLWWADPPGAFQGGRRSSVPQVDLLSGRGIGATEAPWFQRHPGVGVAVAVLGPLALGLGLVALLGVFGHKSTTTV
jgi:hypothetical protein